LRGRARLLVSARDRLVLGLALERDLLLPDGFLRLVGRRFERVLGDRGALGLRLALERDLLLPDGFLRLVGRSFERALGDRGALGLRLALERDLLLPDRPPLGDRPRRARRP